MCSVWLVTEDGRLWSAGLLIVFPPRDLGGVFLLPVPPAAAFTAAPSCFAQYRTALLHVTPLLEHHSPLSEKKCEGNKNNNNIYSTQLVGGGHRVHIVQLNFCFVTRLSCALFVALGWLSDMLAEVLAQINQCHQWISTVPIFFFDLLVCLFNGTRWWAPVV